MTDEIRNELQQVSVSYPEENLQQTYYILLKPKIREAMADNLTRFLRPLCMAGESLTDDEKARLIYEMLSESLVYDDADHSKGDDRLRYTYAGGITSGKAVCMGIAEMYTLMGTALGLRVQTVIGYGGDPVRKGGLHAWNLVWLKDGDVMRPYHIDLTWDLAAHAKIRGFRYYLKSDAYMEKNNHTWLKERYPSCPEDRSPAQIPKIRPAAIRFLCQRFDNMRHSLALVKE